MNKQYKNDWLSKIQELTMILALFIMLDIQNLITNTCFRDVSSKNQYAIPNLMTEEVLNI